MRPRPVAHSPNRALTTGERVLVVLAAGALVNFAIVHWWVRQSMGALFAEFDLVTPTAWLALTHPLVLVAVGLAGAALIMAGIRALRVGEARAGRVLVVSALVVALLAGAALLFGAALPVLVGNTALPAPAQLDRAP